MGETSSYIEICISHNNIAKYTHTQSRLVLKVMPPISLHHPMTSEVNISSMIIEDEPSCQYHKVFALLQIAVGCQTGKMVFDMKVCIKQKCSTGFQDADKIIHIDAYQSFLNIYKNHTSNVGTVSVWIMHFSSSKICVCDKSYSKLLCTAVNTKWRTLGYQW